jgi:glycosyltransferase involved in cell wall biosynthesis
MNKQHQNNHGKSVGFAADIICGWIPVELQRNLRPAQRTRYINTGPSLWIARTSKRSLKVPHETDSAPKDIGIVCENLHSVRFKGYSNVNLFMDQFLELASFMAEQGKQIALRPHPGGQYTLKNNVHLPENVLLENRPAYKVNWDRYSFGISAPSSVLFDLMTHDVPTLVWQDPFYNLDCTQLPFLPTAQTAEGMKAFATRPHDINLKQHDQRLYSIMLDDDKVINNFLSVFCTVLGLKPPSSHRSSDETSLVISKERGNKLRLLAMAPSRRLPTLVISFIRPLVKMDSVAFKIIDKIKRVQGGKSSPDELSVTCERLIDKFKPDVLVLCREYSREAQAMLSCCKKRGIKTVYHIDDLLYDPSSEVLDKKKYQAYLNRSPLIKDLLQSSDFIYCSTKEVEEEIRTSLGHPSVFHENIVESVYSEDMIFTRSREKIIGYTGYGHTQDLALIEDVLIDILKQNKDWRFELIGTMVPSQNLLALGNQITLIPPESDFKRFLNLLGSRQWSIGICPLINNKFNRLKANVKWIEYSQKNIATIASYSPVYIDSCSDRCGLLCKTTDEWSQALELLMKNPDVVNELVHNAQAKIRAKFLVEHHIDQLQSIFKDRLRIST